MTTRRPERIAMVVDKGCLRPADDLSASRLRARGYRRGDEVFVEIRKPRSPRHHRLAHALGHLIAEQVEDFEGLDAHAVLKRLQLESGIACEEIGIRVAGQWFRQRIPLSLSFESMDEVEFQDVYKGLCRHVAETYWRGLTDEQIADMAELMPAQAV